MDERLPESAFLDYFNLVISHLYSHEANTKEFAMHQQMCWLSSSGSDGEKILHLQAGPGQPWRPYTAFPQYSVPDYRIPGGSKGWATYQKLLKAGWKLVPSARASEFISNTYIESDAQANNSDSV